MYLHGVFLASTVGKSNNLPIIHRMVMKFCTCMFQTIPRWFWNFRSFLFKFDSVSKRPIFWNVFTALRYLAPHALLADFNGKECLVFPTICIFCQNCQKGIENPCKQSIIRRSTDQESKANGNARSDGRSLFFRKIWASLTKYTNGVTSFWKNQTFFTIKIRSLSVWRQIPYTTVI